MSYRPIANIAKNNFKLGVSFKSTEDSSDILLKDSDSLFSEQLSILSEIGSLM